MGDQSGDRPPLKYGFQPPDELFELAGSVRNVVDKMLVIEHSHDELVAAKREMDRIAERLDTLGRKGLQVRLMPGTEAGPDDKRPYFGGDATRWHYNPLNPPMTVTIENGVVRGTVELGLAYEGPPGAVHGGFVAMILDQLLGQVNGANGIAAMTATLTVTYRRPTPLLTELAVEAWPPEIVEQRKCITRGRIKHGGTVTAEAEGLFILPDPERLELPHLSHPARQWRG